MATEFEKEKTPYSIKGFKGFEERGLIGLGLARNDASVMGAREERPTRDANERELWQTLTNAQDVMNNSPTLLRTNPTTVQLPRFVDIALGHWISAHTTEKDVQLPRPISKRLIKMVGVTHRSQSMMEPEPMEPACSRSDAFND